MASSRSSLGGDTLHSTSITEEGICVVVEEGETGLVELSGAVGLGNGETDGVGETLTERASGDLNAGCIML